MGERLIFHVDVNSAYLSWEAVRRVKNGEPDLRDIPSAIGGDKDKRTGIILAKSIPAKRFGIKTGEPVGMALRKCPTLVLAPPDFKLYVAGSRAFMSICRDYSPVVEQYSVDECFIDMTGSHVMFPDPIETAHALRNRVRDTYGFTVNVGIGSNKLLAKMAGDFEKPDRVHTLFSHEIEQKLWPLPVSDLLGVGAATAQTLNHNRIRCIGDIVARGREAMQVLVGDKPGAMLYEHACGIDDSPVAAQPEQAKGYSVSTTLEEDVADRTAAHTIMLMLCDSVCARMRADGAKAFGVSVTTRTLDFKNRSHQRKLDIATDITDEVYALSKQLLAELWDGYTPLRLLGVSLFDITREDTEQLTLFAQEDKTRHRTIDKTVDDIRRRFGAQGIVRGAALDADDRIGRKYKAQLEND